MDYKVFGCYKYLQNQGGQGPKEVKKQTNDHLQINILCSKAKLVEHLKKMRLNGLFLYPKLKLFIFKSNFRLKVQLKHFTFLPIFEWFTHHKSNVSSTTTYG